MPLTLAAMFFKRLIFLSIFVVIITACSPETDMVASQPTAPADSKPQLTATATTLPTAEPSYTPPPSPSATAAIPFEPPDLRYLQAAIEDTLAGFGGFSSYVVIDLSSGERIARNDDVAIAGMSLIKVPILINIYRILDLPLTAEQSKLIVETTAQSSNYAANLLLQIIAGKEDAYAGADIVSQSMRDLGIFNTFIAVPIDADPKPDRLNTVLTPANLRTDITTYADPFRQTTTGDLAALLSMIYDCAEMDSGPLHEVYGQAISQEECQDMLEKMKLNELAKLLENGLPEGVPFAHKVGWIDDTHGDGGIVYSPGGDYILVMALYGKDWLEWEDSAPFFEQIARQAYAHFNEPGIYEGIELPPTSTAVPQTPTPDLPHAVVTGTNGVGLTVRQTPGGAEVAIIPDGTILTLLPEGVVISGGFAWQRVRTPSGDEGWAATDYFTPWENRTNNQQ
jgi:beta-lactamase class A